MRWPVRSGCFDLIDETPITPDAPDAVSLPHGAGSVAF